MKFITKEGLKELDNYKYVSGGYSWLDNKINPFWEWAVTLLPTWMAPNLVTFIGWVLVILSYAVMLFYDYTFSRILPSWTFFWASLCIFLYSTLDAIDGKQARRTKSGSPLGQLFDHGCDSFSMSFFVLGVCQAIRLERDDVFFIFLAAQLTWWSSNWNEYHTGVLKTNVGNFGVTETELICCLIHLLTGLFGQQMWDISIGSLSMKQIIVYAVGGLLIFLCTYSYFITLSSYPGKRLEMLGQVSSLVAIFIMEYIWMNLSIYNRYVGIILLNFGILMSLSICKIIISSVTKMKLRVYDQEIGLFILFTIVMVILNKMKNESGMVVVFWVCFIVNILEVLVFLSRSIQQITDYMGIYCFSLQKKERKLD